MLTGFELFACEMLPESVCELNGSPMDNPQSGDDNCLCCCFHVVLASVDRPATPVNYAYLPAEAAERVPTGTAITPELPPRS
jgi:hypothetical protein